MTSRTAPSDALPPLPEEVRDAMRMLESTAIAFGEHPTAKGSSAMALEVVRRREALEAAIARHVAASVAAEAPSAALREALGALKRGGPEGIDCWCEPVWDDRPASGPPRYIHTDRCETARAALRGAPGDAVTASPAGTPLPEEVVGLLDAYARACAWYGASPTAVMEDANTKAADLRVALIAAIRRHVAASVAAERGPIQMFLTCPFCRERHIDRGEFATKPHHTHACQGCGLAWRPAIGPTVGVEFLPGFKDAPAAAQGGDR
jgi:hypothetical protein